jgi:hypothetical protein
MNGNGDDKRTDASSLFKDLPKMTETQEAIREAVRANTERRLNEIKAEIDAADERRKSTMVPLNCSKQYNKYH